jgi:hypothetical protein
MGRSARPAHHRGLAHEETAMWTTLFDRRRPLPPAALLDADDDAPDDAGRNSGWHESSWALAVGADVTELTDADASAWFTGAMAPC